MIQICNLTVKNFMNVGDDERGMMIMEWNKESEFHDNQLLLQIYQNL